MPRVLCRVPIVVHGGTYWGPLIYENDHLLDFYTVIRGLTKKGPKFPEKPACKADVPMLPIPVESRRPLSTPFPKP